MIQVPGFESVVLIGDNAQLLAEISSFFRRDRRYLPVSDGPRMARPDWINEVTRRSNMVAYVQARKVLFAGMPDDAIEALSQHIPTRMLTRVNNREEAKLALLGIVRPRDKEFRWGERNLGIGLMLARQAGATLTVDPSIEPPNVTFVEAGQHILIACEAGNEMSQVIASNLAHSIDGSLVTFNPPSDTETDELIESLYQVGSGTGTANFEELSARVRGFLPREVLADRFSEILFITHRLPYGIGISERPSSHLISYPDLGRTIIQSLWATQNPDRSARTALLIQPGQVVGSEIKVIAEALAKNRTLIHVLEGPGASVHKVDLLLQAVPWDLIVFSSHAGDSPGSRDTYVYLDDEGRERRLVVEQAISIGLDPGKEDIPVNTYIQYQELDGVSWTDKTALNQLPIGSAIHAFHRLTLSQRVASCIESIRLLRVRKAMAIQLYDHVWFPALHSLAPRASPLVVVNACSSWHRMSELFIYAGARAYVGTMFPVTDPEAQEVAGRLLDRELGQPLSRALWRAQRAVYDDSARRPYILIGLPFCRVHRNQVNSPQYLHRELMESAAELSDRLAENLPDDLRRNFARHREIMLEVQLTIERAFTPDGRAKR